VVEFEGLKVQFGDKIIFENLSLRLKASESVIIMGPSGTGKSVCLRAIVGLVAFQSGTIRVDEIDLESEKDAEKIRAICGLIFQFPALLDSITIQENWELAVAASLMRGIKPFDIQEVLDLIALPKAILNQYSYELSLGHQKMAQMARALIGKPKYLLLDEPTTGLDPILTRSVNQLTRRLIAQVGCGVLTVTHDMKSALEIGDRFYFMEKGEWIAQGNQESILKSQHSLVRVFMEDAKIRGWAL